MSVNTVNSEAHSEQDTGDCGDLVGGVAAALLRLLLQLLVQGVGVDGPGEGGPGGVVRVLLSAGNIS